MDDPAVWPGPPAVGDRACCCPAKPVVRVVMPAAPARPHPVDLLLCGHHYRVSRDALAVAGAVIVDQTGAIAETGVSGPEKTPRRANIAPPP